MNRLKKIIPVILLCIVTVFMLTGCFNPFSLFIGNKVSKEDAEAMKGEWELVAAEVDGKMVTAKDLGATMSFSFSDNGKAAYTLNGSSENYKWEKDGNLITIYTDSSNSKGNTAVLSENYFKLHWNYNGKTVELIFAKKGTDAADPNKYVNGTTATTNTTTSNTQANTQTQTNTQQQNTQSKAKEPVLLLGDWHLVAHIQGTTRTQAEAIETANIYYTFYESGEYTLRNFNSDEYGMYRKDGNSLSMKSDDGYSSVVGSLDGDELTVYDPKTNLNYVYKKQY